MRNQEMLGYAVCKTDEEKLYGEFCQKAEAISAVVHRVPDFSGAARIIAGLAKDLGVKKIVAAATPLVIKTDLEGVLEGTPVYQDNLRLHAAGADMGISEADLAIAETGTLAHHANGIDGRLVSMLPPVHVALIRTDSLVASLRDAIEQYGRNAGSLPGYLTFISGPSRTADIERVLTIGVHGPEILHVIFIESPGGDGR
ncbi:MAG: LutC/YkgG family protein [Bacillota bacterium]